VARLQADRGRAGARAHLRQRRGGHHDDPEDGRRRLSRGAAALRAHRARPGARARAAAGARPALPRQLRCTLTYRSPRPRPRAGASHGRGPAQQVSGRPPLWRVAAEGGRVPAVEAALPAGPQPAAGAGGAGAAARAARSRQLEADQGAFTTHQGAPPTLCPRVHALPRTSPRALTPGRAWASLRARASSPRSRRGAPGPSSSGSGRRRMCS
jgi:hypothetical protein